MKQFCMKIDLISQVRENVLFLSSNMAAMTSHENALFSEKKVHVAFIYLLILQLLLKNYFASVADRRGFYFLF